MKKIISLLIPLVLAAGLAEGSLPAVGQGKGAANPTSAESSAGIVPEIETELQVVATFKTHLPGNFGAADPHGTPHYRLQLDVDGKRVEVSGEVQEEAISSHPGDPENGSGVRYRFRTVLRLKEGTHHVAVSLPSDGITVGREVVLLAGRTNRLVVEPVYGKTSEKARPSARKSTFFGEGINTFQFSLNGRRL